MANAKRSPATPEEIWGILREVSEGQKETDRQMKETDRIIKENAEETDRRIQETDSIMRENIKGIKDLKKLFEDQWGKLMEALVKGNLIKLLNERNIDIQGIAREHERKYNGKEYEFDIIAINGDAVVVVEVKTTLRLEDIGHFIRKLEVFKQVFPEYESKDIYGAVAYLKQNEGTAKNAEKKGLYVIRAVGSSAKIVNKKNFQAKKFV